MSRIGKKTIIVPSGVTATITGNHILIKGSKGELGYTFAPSITVALKDNSIQVRRKDDERLTRSLHGLVRTLINNMIQGVSAGYEKRLEILGVGYRAQVAGKKITLSLGYSHPIEYMAPEGVQFKMDEENKNVVIISGIDKQLVGETAAQIRKFRLPEPYKGKGIRYLGENVRRKAGKAAAKASA